MCALKCLGALFETHLHSLILSQMVVVVLNNNVSLVSCLPETMVHCICYFSADAASCTLYPSLCMINVFSFTSKSCRELMKLVFHSFLMIQPQAMFYGRDSWGSITYLFRESTSCQQNSLLHNNGIEFCWDKNTLKHTLFSSLFTLIRGRNSSSFHYFLRDFDEVPTNPRIVLIAISRSCRAISFFKQGLAFVAFFTAVVLEMKSWLQNHVMWSEVTRISSFSCFPPEFLFCSKSIGIRTQNVA